MNGKKDRLDHINRLSAITSNKGVSILKAAVSPGGHCPMHTALATVRNVKGISTLVVGMPECGYYSRYVVRNKVEEKELHYTYVLEENEVVFGCREGLIKALYEMDREGAEAILVIMTCIPELIGEDIQAVVYEIQDSLTAKLLPLSLPHYKHNGYESGYTFTIGSFINLMEETKTNPSQVNILGNAVGSDMDVIRTALKEKYYINELSHPITLANLKLASAGKVNLVFSRSAAPLAVEMEEKFKIPFIPFYNRYAPEDIDKCYKQLADIVELELTKKVAPVKTAIADLERLLGKKLAGLKYMLTDIGIDTLSLADYLSNFGLVPELIHLEEYERGDKVFQERLRKQKCNPYVCYISQIQDLDSYTNELEAVFSLGALGKGFQEKGVKAIHMKTVNGLTGYDRTLTLLELLKEAFII